MMIYHSNVIRLPGSSSLITPNPLVARESGSLNVMFQNKIEYNNQLNFNRIYN